MPSPDELSQADILGILCRAPAAEVKTFADALLPDLGPVEVLYNRTGLVMQPMRDPAQGALFYLGEVLVSEAHIRLTGAAGCPEGYAACLGRDLQQALAIALLDAAAVGGLARERLGAFVAQQTAVLAAADEVLLRQVEATRAEMETF